MAIKSIKVASKLPDGIYVHGSVQGYPLLFTTDTGASKTIISKKVFEAMKEEDKPVLESSTRLVGPSGSIIKGLGKGSFDIRIGSVQLEVDAMVADIEDDGLLGIDVLQNGDSGPADLILSKSVLQIQGKEVPIIQVGMHKRARRVTAADHFILPPQSESLIDVNVEELQHDNITLGDGYLIEPTKQFEENYPVKIADTIVDISGNDMCTVRMVNPLPTRILKKRGAILGKAVPTDKSAKPPDLAKERQNHHKSQSKDAQGQEATARTTRICVGRNLEDNDDREYRDDYPPRWLAKVRNKLLTPQ